MSTWTKQKLGDVADVFDCPHSTPIWADNGYFVVRNYNLSDGRIIREKASYTDFTTFTSRTKRAVPKQGDSILSREAPIGQVGYVNTNDKICLGQRVVLIRPKKVDSRYLLYQLISPSIQRQFKQSENSGATVSNLRIPLIENTIVQTPDFSIQKNIASVLSAYDDLIENNEKRIKILEEMAERLYREWFVKFQFPGHEKLCLIDSGTEYGKIPEGWEVKRFYDVVKNFDSKRKPISSIKRQEIQGIYPYYGAAKIIDYVNNYIFDGRYLLIAEDGSVITPDGKPMLQFVDEKFWVSNHAHIIQGEIISTEMIYLRMRQFSVSSLITGAAQPKITKENLSRVLFLIPNNEIKIRFGSLVKNLFDQVFNIERQNKILSKTRDLLIPQLVTGKREVKN